LDPKPKARVDANGKPYRRARAMQPDYGRLCGAARTAMHVLRPYRETRREMVREFAGARWGDSAARKPVPLNLLALYEQIVGRALVSQNPRYLLSTFDRDKKPDAAKAMAWANDRVEEMDLADALRRCVVDALFGFGVMKVALARPDDAMASGWQVQAGMPFAEPIDLDDFLIDTKATRFRQATWVAHRYRLPRAAAEERFGRKAAGDLPDDELREHNATGDQRIATLGRSQEGDDEEFEPHVAVWEFYLPAYRRVVTLADDATGYAETRRKADRQGDPLPLEEVEWLGPDCGPYHYLAPTVVPGNLMPKGPLMDLFELHDAVNELLRKSIRQAKRQKSNTAVGNAAAEDGQRMVNAPDGQAVYCNSPEQIRQIDSGGPNPQNFAFLLQLKEMFSWAGGNLDLMGGLSPQSKTATQDKMLSENASRALGTLQEQTVKFSASVGKALLWYWWYHPELRMVSEYSPAGLPGVSTTLELTPAERRRTPYSAIGVKVDPYTLVYQTPQQKAAQVNQIVQQVIIPGLPVLQAQGVGFDAHAYVELMAKYYDLPELTDVVVYQEPAAAGSNVGGGGGTHMPASTNRTYTRENVAGTSRQGTDAAMAEAMAGVDTGGDNRGAA
jgi:hypothetical protein